MTAQHPIRRNATARELAERFGKDPSTIRRFIAQPRADWLADVETRHIHIRELRAQGLSMRAIAAQLDISVGTVHYALHKDAESA